MSVATLLDRIASTDPALPYGEVRRVTSGRFEADGPPGTVGDLCRIGRTERLAEIGAVDRTGVVLVPVEEGEPPRLGERVSAVPHAGVAVGDAHAGRAIDALGRAIDGKGPIASANTLPLRGSTPGALDRCPPSAVLETGIRAIDGLLTLGQGQRIGIFAASGVGKTSLVEQIVANTPADRCILCLVGERGREVQSAWATIAGRADASKFTLVAATSDESAAMRARSVSIALCLAEHWRNRGEHVLVVVDSVTRLAMALREIGLAAGEPPIVRAYTPNVFAALPRVVERCGAVTTGGAITAVMTVLSETDDNDDPVAETMKSLLDGHIVLSRGLAERGHFPAIDVVRSVSRQAVRLVSAQHGTAAAATAAQLGVWEDARVMIESGIYQAGSTAQIDAAIAGRDAIIAFLKQRQDERSEFAETVRVLAMLGGRRG